MPSSSISLCKLFMSLISVGSPRLLSIKVNNSLYCAAYLGKVGSHVFPSSLVSMLLSLSLGLAIVEAFSLNVA